MKLLVNMQEFKSLMIVDNFLVRVWIIEVQERSGGQGVAGVILHQFA